MTAPANNDRPSETLKPPPPEGCASWLEAAIGMIDPTDMVATGEDTEPVVGGEAINLARAELAEFRAFKAAYDEAIRGAVEMACKAACPMCRGNGNGYATEVMYHKDHKWVHQHTTSRGLIPCYAYDIHQAFAEPGNSSELPNGSPDTLRKLVDAAESIADYVGPTFAWCDERCKDNDDCPCPRCTILRLAPQFREQAP